MKSGLRAVAVAMALVGVSSGLSSAGNHQANAESAPGTATAAAHPTTVLPSKDAYAMVVDDAHEQVLISLGNGSVLVTDLAGAVRETLTGITAPRDMVLSEDGSAVYVTQLSTPSLARIDTRTLAVSQVAMPDGVCPTSVTFTGGKVWFAHRSNACSATGEPRLSSYDPETGEVSVSSATLPRSVIVRALPERPDRLVAYDRADYLGVYDVTSNPPALVAEKVGGSWAARCEDVALVSGGDQVVVACLNPFEHQVFRTADLSAAPSIGPVRYPTGVAASSDGAQVAAGAGHAEGCDIFVRDIRGGTPGTPVNSYDLGENLWLKSRMLRFSASGRLYAVSNRDADTSLLHVLSGPSKCPSRLTMTTPRAVKYGHGVSGRGSIGHTLPASTTATVTRTDRAGTHDIGTAKVWADGQFAFGDHPTVSGEATYTVSYAGDDVYGPGSVSTTVKVRPKPYDVNGDGYAEVVVGAPGEDLGSVRNAGQFHLLYGNYNGPTTSGNRAVHQDTPGVPGAVEAGDRFGHTNVSGDFNGDGYADLAVSAPTENVGDTTDVGCVWIFYGSSAGLRTDNVQSITLSRTPLGGTKYAHFGNALASGDFDADGTDDLAVGADGADSVLIAMGTSGGLDPNLTHLTEDSDGIPGVRHAGEAFGGSLATGDVDHDGGDDLAIGAAYDRDDRGYATGAVTVVYSGQQGLSHRAQRFTKETEGVPGAAAGFGTDRSDQFGHQVLLADADSDGHADLVVGAPGAPVTYDGKKKADAGTVTVLYSNDTEISTFRAAEVTQLTPGMPGTPGAKDLLGTTLAAGDADGDGRTDLAVYSPGDTYVTVIPGTDQGPSWYDAKGWTQNAPRLHLSSEPGDGWGNSLRFADVTGYGFHCLIVGADGENDGSGAVTVMSAWSSGLTGYGDVYTQNTTGIPGTPEAGDGFGTF